MASILVVDDESLIRGVVSAALEREGHSVREASDGRSAVAEAEHSLPDLVVLDVGLPDIDGWEVCRRLRTRGDVPVLFLTALADEANLVRGLRLGGDDYLTKPFNPDVLAARVAALLRRAHRPDQGIREVVRIGGVSVDLVAGEVRCDGVLVKLTASEFRILASLVRRPGAVLSSHELMRAAQGYDMPEDEANDIVKVHVRRIRRKIEPDPDHPRYVLNVRGLGYVVPREVVQPTGE
jgi:DNA-binding response OmpR family regulator